MEHTKLTELLNKVAQGEVSVEKAALELKTNLLKTLVLPNLTITERFVREQRKSFMVLVRLRNRF